MAIPESRHGIHSKIIGGIKVVAETDLPYNIHISAANLSEMYTMVGLSPTEITSQVLSLKRKHIFTNGETHDLAGESHPSKPIVTLYTDWAWEERQADIKEIRGHIEANMQNKQIRKVPNLSSFYSPRRVEAYLNTAPPERAIKFMEKLINKIWDNNLNSALIHELKHQADTRKSMSKIAALLSLYGGDIVALLIGVRTGIWSQKNLPRLGGLYTPGLDVFLTSMTILQPLLSRLSTVANVFEDRALATQRRLNRNLPNAISLVDKI